ncbi:DUF853 family protein [Candidatus Micrarchaeota archaeon]|nr:DUF853 family protein [Candidatus Micrarchaeota archaeon]
MPKTPKKGTLNEFKKLVEEYSSQEGIPLGRPVLGERTLTSFKVRIPFSSLTKHGLIAGSTGTGKSRAVQEMAEMLCEAGIPVLLSDVKGDVSGCATEGSEERARQRATETSYDWSPKAYPTNYWSATERLIPLRLSIGDVDPILLSRLMGLNPTQESHLVTAFIYASRKGRRLSDWREVMNLIEELKANPDEMAGINANSMDVVLRKMAELEAEGFGELFGEPSLEIVDLIRESRINVLNLADVRRKSEYFSIIIGFILYEVFKDFPDVGEVEKPKLVIFFDEAHYLFEGANKTLVSLMANVLRQIRSKGVGVFFITQDASDLPEQIRKMLGTKIQFAVRAFTGKELVDIRNTAKSFPPSSFYKLEEELKKLEAGVSFVSSLDERGKALEPLKVVWYPPKSFMDVVDEAELISSARKNELSKKYGRREKGVLPFSRILENPTGKKDVVNRAEVQRKNGKTFRWFKGFLRYVGVFVLWFVDLILKIIWKTINYLLFKPLRSFVVWMTKKPKRIIFLALVLATLYLVLSYLSEVREIVKVVKETLGW